MDRLSGTVQWDGSVEWFSGTVQWNGAAQLSGRLSGTVHWNGSVAAHGTVQWDGSVGRLSGTVQWDGSVIRGTIFDDECVRIRGPQSFEVPSSMMNAFDVAAWIRFGVAPLSIKKGIAGGAWSGGSGGGEVGREPPRREPLSFQMVGEFSKWGDPRSLTWS